MNCILLEPRDFCDDNNRLARLTGRRYKHCTEVIRCKEGDRVKIGLIDGQLGSGTIRRIDENSIELEVILSENPPPPLPMTLIIALPRPKSLKKSIEAASSLGIKKIFIIESWRVEKSYWSSPVLSAEVLRRHMLLGLEQARDTVVPHIEIRRRFKPFAEDELPELIKGTQPFVAHPYGAQPCPDDVEQPVVLIIGPEGGFIQYEIDLLQKIGCTPIVLGQRILRIETAIAAFTGRLMQ
jgi:16S rRNA (uracil1498-N3)-methyltransferase